MQDGASMCSSVEKLAMAFMAMGSPLGGLVVDGLNHNPANNISRDGDPTAGGNQDRGTTGLQQLNRLALKDAQTFQSVGLGGGQF
jgi:hypothetical protein